MKEKNINSSKGRNWTIVVYPESAPKNWRGLLDDMHIQWIESPLHDKDVNADGEKKKAHWHVLLTWDGGSQTYAQVKQVADVVNAPIPKKVQSARGLVRYMIHLDNPEKFQYSINDIIAHGGAEVAPYFEMTATNRLSSMKDLMKFIYDEELDNYADFIDYCIYNNDDWFDLAINHNTLAINKMLDAIWQKKRLKNSK